MPFTLTLLLLVSVVVCIQAWQMLKMEQQLESVNNQTSAAQLANQATSVPVDELSKLENIKDTSSNGPLPPAPGEQLQPLNNSILPPPFFGQSAATYRNIQRVQQPTYRPFNNRSQRLQKRPGYEYHLSRRSSVPKIDVREDAHGYMITVEIPGTDEDSISVNLQRQRLTIRAKQGYEQSEIDPSGRFEFRERSSGSLRRSILLREPVNANAMKTRVDNGILMVTIPKIRRQ
jgi:HSP20 family protein